MASSNLPKGYGRVSLGPSNIDSALMRRALFTAVSRAADYWRDNLPPGSSLLDIGCGSQPYRACIESAGLVYTGVDWPQSIHDSGASDIIQWNLGEHPWPFPTASFDALLSTEVLEHQQDPAGFLRECHRLLKDGATLVLTAPLVWPEHESPHDYFRYTQFGHRTLAAECGFEVLSVEPHGGWHQAMAQLLGLYSYHAFPKPWNYATRLVALPVMYLLDFMDRATARKSHLPLTLGYSVMLRKAPVTKNS